NLIWTKEQLLAPLESGMEPPPHPMRLGDTERDYYLLGSAGVPAARGQDARGQDARGQDDRGQDDRGQDDEGGPAAAAAWTPGPPRHESGSDPAGDNETAGGAADDGSEAAQ